MNFILFADVIFRLGIILFFARKYNAHTNIGWNTRLWLVTGNCSYVWCPYRNYYVQIIDGPIRHSSPQMCIFTKFGIIPFNYSAYSTLNSVIINGTFGIQNRINYNLFDVNRSCKLYFISHSNITDINQRIIRFRFLY